MESVFNDHVFPKYMSQQVMKSQMDGFNDPTLRDFSLLDSSALMKDEFKADRFDDEFIRSFLNAAKELAAAGRKAIDKPGMYLMLEYSYAIPVMFLTRHCIELAIKRAIKRHQSPLSAGQIRQANARQAAIRQQRGSRFVFGEIRRAA